MIGRFVKLFGSLRFTLFLILSLSVIFLLGLWIPQKAVIQFDLYLQWKAASPIVVSVLDALGLTSIYTSPITLALWTLFFLNLSLVMWRRISVVRNTISRPPEQLRGPAAATAFHHQSAIQLPEKCGIDAAQKALEAAGYRVSGSAGSFYAVRNRLSPLATLLFHFSFLLILLGGVVSIYTRFAGTVDLAEGEEFHGALAQYNPGSRLPKIGEMPRARFIIKNIEPGVTQGTSTGLIVTLADAKQAVHTVEVNRPFKIDDTFFVIRNLGVAPLVILQDRKGRELDGAYVKLNVLRGKQDVFTMEGLEFIVDFFPDHVIENGEDGTRSSEIKNPVFRLYIQKGKTYLARRNLHPGATIRFGDYRLEIREMPYWVRFYVVKERGVWIIYTGFAIATIALIWRLVFYRREMIGMVRHKEGIAVLHLAGRAEFYKLLFQDEFDSLIRKIESSCMNREN